jgi:hypothetical protein
MARIICKTCGAEAQSKCPYCRNVFPTGGEWFDHIHFTVRQGDGEYGKPGGSDEIQICFEFSFAKDQKATREDFKQNTIRLYNLAHSVTSEQFLRMFCNHNWAFAPGEKSEIDCGHKAE